MNITNALKGSATLRAKTALVVYVRDHRGEPRFEEHEDGDYDEGASEPGETAAFVSIHPVRPTESGNLEIGAGRCLTYVELEDLLKSTQAGASQRRRILPPNVLCADGSRLAWFVPSTRRPIYFATRDDKFNRRMNAKTVMHPALLFLADARGLCVWALDSDDRPGDQTPLFVAPYYNLYKGGRMCRGSAKYPDGLGVDTLAAWESAFFRTQFTHSNYHGVKLTQFEGGHDALWDAMLKAKQFPVESLKPAGKLTAGEAINLSVGGEG